MRKRRGGTRRKDKYPKIVKSDRPIKIRETEVRGRGFTFGLPKYQVEKKGM